MTALAGVKDDLLLQIPWVLDKRKERKEVSCSDFEPVAKARFLTARLRRLRRGASDLDTSQSRLSTSTSPVASPTKTPTPAKRFKEAVGSPAKSADCYNFETRLAEAELSLMEHKQRFRELNRKAEASEKGQLNLIVYNVQETAEEDDHGVETFLSLLNKFMRDGRNLADA